jgi:hypothetical protein
MQAVLQPGSYVLRIADDADLRYRIHITLGGANEDPTPLTIGPAPVLQLRLSDLTPAVATPAAATSPTGMNATSIGVTVASFVESTTARVVTPAAASPTVTRPVSDGSTPSAPPSAISGLPLNSFINPTATPSAPTQIVFSTSPNMGGRSLTLGITCVDAPDALAPEGTAAEVRRTTMPGAMANENEPIVAAAAVVPRLTRELESLAARLASKDVTVIGTETAAAPVASEGEDKPSYAAWCTVVVAALAGLSLGQLYRTGLATPRWLVRIPTAWRLRKAASAAPACETGWGSCSL